MNNLNLEFNNDILLPNTEQTSKEQKDKTNYKKTSTFIYNKKWLILLGLCIIFVIIYIYKYDILINIPISFPYPNTILKKTSDITCDDITEFDNDKDWNLKEEIQKYMELQDTYIKNLNNNLTINVK